MAAERPTAKPPITYPFAKDGDLVIPVSEARPGGNYACPGCGEPMIPKRGSMKAHHFAHKVVGRCDPDHTLHETAKMYVEKLFLNAKKSGDHLDIQHACPCCGSVSHTDMAAGDYITREETVIQDTRSDLAVFRDGRPYMIIEVVVTHDLEDGTRAAYEKSGVLVVRVHPSWVVGGITCKVGDALNASTCGPCTARDRHVSGFLEGVSEYGGSPRPITHDRFGRTIYSRLGSAALRQATLIMRCGFAQQPSRPTLFKHETEYWNVFADIDSTKVLPIWETNADAAVYAFPKNGMVERDCTPDCMACVTSKARRVLEKAGVRTRRYFLDNSHHWHRGHSNVRQYL